MRKKYLSALLFGALLVTSAGTFTSCKDYDDDINNLQEQITANADAIKALEELVKAGKYVSAVSGNGNVITFTFTDGTTQQVTVESAEQETQTVTIGEDGEVIINGEGTGFYTTKTPSEEEVEAGLVKKGENGTWEVLGENGEYTDTKIPVSGITVSGSEAEGYTFTIVNANGESQTVKLPSASSAITDILFGTNKVKNYNVKEFGTAVPLGSDVVGIAVNDFTFNGTFNGTELLKNASDWKGNKKLPNDGDFIYSSPSTLDIRINPVDANISTVPFYLTNTKNADLSPLKFNARPTQEDWEAPISKDNIGSRAVTGNGLWTLSMDNVVIAKNSNNAIAQGINDAVNGKWAYALNAGHASRSLYDLSVKKAEAPVLSTLQLIQGGTISTAITITDGTVSETADKKYKVGSPVYLSFENPSAVYDVYIEPVKSSDIDVYGLTFDQDAHSFTIGKNPDVSTVAASFELYVWTVDNEGQVRRETVKVNIDTEISTAAEYELQTHPVNYAHPEKDNHFGIDLSIMKENLGTDGLQKWEQNVDLEETSFDGIYTDVYCTQAAADRATGDFNAYVVEKLDDNNKVNAHETNVDKANFIQVNVDNTKVNNLELNKTYYFKFTFNNSDGDGLKTIIVPVQFTAPTLAAQFVKESAVFANGGNLAYAYLNVRDQLNRDENSGVPAYSLKNAFVSMPASAGVTLTLADDDKLIEDETSKDLAGLGNSQGVATNTIANFDENIKLYLKNDKNLNDGTNRPFGYGQELTITAEDARYGTSTVTAGWKYANNDGKYTFKIKVMSPIFEGTVSAINNVFEIPATDIVNGYKMTNKDIEGTTYNNVKYAVLPDILGDNGAADWSRPDIEKVTADSENTRVVRIGNNGDVYAATPDPEKPTVLKEEGYIQVIPENIAETSEATVNINVTDIWGYTKSNPITVKVTVDKAGE